MFIVVNLSFHQMKYFLASLLALLILVIGFYFWGSSSLYPSEDYTRLSTYAAPPAQYKPGDTLEVMTFNIGFLSGMDNNLPVPQNPELYRKNMQDAQELLTDLQVDFVGLQEIDFASARSLDMNMLDSLALAGDYAFAFKAVNWDKRYVPFPYGWPSVNYGRMLSGQALLSKHPLTRPERLVLDAPEAAPFYYRAFYLDRLLQTAFIPLGQDTLVLMNIHLEAFDEETREKQAAVVKATAENYAKRYPTLLIGDFNARPSYASQPIPTDETMGYFEKSNVLQPAIGERQYMDDESAHFTFDTANPIEQLDYIFFSKGRIKPVSARVVTEAEQISDHYPVVFSFIIPADTATN